jgi:TatD DNase family protein
MALLPKNCPMLVDTHAHLYLEHFRDDLAAVVDRCTAHDVRKIVLPNIDLASVTDLAATCRAYPDLFHPALGLHPCSVKANWEDELDHIEEIIESGLKEFPQNHLVGIGEIGLDYYWDLTFQDAQKAALRRQITWAKSRDLPIILHCRDSFDDLYEIVAEENDAQLTGIFHCFTGTKEEAQKIINLGGFMMGLGGVLTFKNSENLRQVVREIPMEFLLLETDSPYLTPAPFRGKRNESSYVHFVAETLASIKGITVDETARITHQNAVCMFGPSIG